MIQVYREEFILWSIIALVLLAIPLGALYTAFNGKYLNGVYLDEKGVKTIYVYGWTHEEGGWDPSEIVVKAGEKVRLVIRSMDMAHGLQIPDLGIDTGVIKPGYEYVIEVTFDKPGEYTFYCSVYCSPLHYKMMGKIIVLPG